jgi:N-acyl-D-aspartate/D-glutamate deacylase
LTDLLIANARIVDGTGDPAFTGSVAVQGDRIQAVIRHPTPQLEARRIDAAGRVLAPGFIDVHNHSDIVPFVEPGMDSMLRQGVTSVVVGNCGSSAAPPAGAIDVAEFLSMGPDQLDLGWQTFAEYLDRVEAARPAINLATLVGHGALRLEVMVHERRAPTPEEMGRMKRLLEEGLGAGAVGLSTGLIYAPGIHASTEEIVELASSVARRGGLYASHIRGEGERVFDAVAECVEIGRRAGVPSHISHLKLETSLVWGRAEELLGAIDAARASGDDVSADQYPYTAWESSLSSCLPPWASPEDLPRLLADPPSHERLVHVVEKGEVGWQSSVKGLGWDRLVIVAHAPAPEHTGKSVAQIAEEANRPPADAMFDLLHADPFTSVIGHGMVEEDVRTIVAREDVMVASDGLAVSPTGPVGRFNVHPRYYGTFPRVLARYVRDDRLLSLEAAVRKMTSLPADRFGLVGRGRIAKGAFADLVLFDPDRIADRATFESPHAFAQGIDLVVVNGTVAWDGGIGGRGGRVLRRA